MTQDSVSLDTVKQTIQINWKEDGLQEVEAEYTCGVFAVNRTAYLDEDGSFQQKEQQWAVTHVTSGFCIQEGFYDRDFAIEFCRLYGELISNDDLTDECGNWKASAYARAVKDALFGDEALPRREMATVIYEDSSFVIKSWFLDLPGHHPLWQNYVLGVISLRDEEGMPPAKKHSPEATHEFLVFALNPKHQPIASKPETHHSLLPHNYAHQIKTDDETAKRIGQVLVDAFEAGQLVAEPSGFYGMRDRFAKIIDMEARIK